MEQYSLGMKQKLGIAQSIMETQTGVRHFIFIKGRTAYTLPMRELCCQA